MTDKEIIKALKCCLSGKEELCKECPLNGKCYGDVDYLLELALDLINRQHEQLEATIAGQETLQKALAEKNREAAALNLDLKVLRKFYNCLKGNSDEIIEENKMLKNEVAELNSDLKLLKNDYDCLKTNFDETVEKNKRLRDKVVGLTAEKDQLIKTFGECQEEAVREFSKAVIDGIDEGYISHSSDIVDFTADYLRGKMAGDTE